MLEIFLAKLRLSKQSSSQTQVYIWLIIINESDTSRMYFGPILKRIPREQNQCLVEAYLSMMSIIKHQDVSNLEHPFTFKLNDKRT